MLKFAPIIIGLVFLSLFTPAKVYAQQINLNDFIAGPNFTSHTLSTGEAISFSSEGGPCPAGLSPVRMNKGGNYEQFCVGGAGTFRQEDTSWAPLPGFQDAFCTNGNKAAITSISVCTSFTDGQNIGIDGAPWAPLSASVGQTWTSGPAQLVPIDSTTIASGKTYCNLSNLSGYTRACNVISSFKLEAVIPANSSFTFCTGIRNPVEMIKVVTVDGAGAGDTFYFGRGMGLIGFEAPGFVAGLMGPGATTGNCRTTGINGPIRPRLEPIGQCRVQDEKYPMRPYPGDACISQVPRPNTIACADRPLPVGEVTYTFTCGGPTTSVTPPANATPIPGRTCTYTIPPTTFVAKLNAAIDGQVQVPFTDFAEFDKPYYQANYRDDKLNYLGDYLGGSGSYFYDSQPLKSTDQITPNPQDILNESSAWQKLTPYGYQNQKKKELQARASQGNQPGRQSPNEVHDYVAVYKSGDSPVPREIDAGSARRITNIPSPPVNNCGLLDLPCRASYLVNLLQWNLTPEGANWKYVPAFTLEDTPGFAYLHLDGYTSREKIYVPHLPRIAEAARDIQNVILPEKESLISLPQPPNSDLAEPLGPQDDESNPGLEELKKFACDLTITGYNAADVVYADNNPETTVASWVHPGGEVITVQPGQTVTHVVRSEFPQDRSRYLFTRIPYLREINDGLYKSGNSVYRTMLPGTYWNEFDLQLDYPAEGTSPESNTSGDINVKIETGNSGGPNKPGGEANMYFRFLYRLRQATETIIKSTNPNGAGSETPPGTFTMPGSGGTCTVPTTGACSVASLSEAFGNNNASVASQICYRESRGHPAILNNHCLQFIDGQPNDRYTRDYSVGLFQINLLAHPNKNWLASNDPAAVDLRTRIAAIGRAGQTCYEGIREDGPQVPGSPNRRYCRIVDEELIQVCRQWFSVAENNIAYARAMAGCYTGTCNWRPWSTAAGCGIVQ